MVNKTTARNFWNLSWKTKYFCQKKTVGLGFCCIYEIKDIPLQLKNNIIFSNFQNEKNPCTWPTGCFESELSATKGKRKRYTERKAGIWQVHGTSAETVHVHQLSLIQADTALAPRFVVSSQNVNANHWQLVRTCTCICKCCLGCWKSGVVYLLYIVFKFKSSVSNACKACNWLIPPYHTSLDF